MRKQVTYIIRHGDSDYYKIGITVDLRVRLKSLQSANPVTLTPLVVFEQPTTCLWVSLEYALHILLRQRKIRGEWFVLPELSRKPFDTICSLLDEVGLTVSRVENHNACYHLWAKQRPYPKKKAPELVDASIVLFLDYRQSSKFKNTVTLDILTGLPQYCQDDVTKSLYRLIRKKFIKRIQVSKRLPGYKLNRSVSCTKN